MFFDALPIWTSDSNCTYHGVSLNFHLGLSHDSCVLFEPSDFSLVRGHVTGLVGTNGAGKTSLAKVIASKEVPGFPADLTIQYISSHENYVFSADESEELKHTPQAYLHTVVQRKLSGLQKEIEGLEDALGDDEDPERIEKISDLLAEKYDLQDELQVSSEEEITQTLDDLEFGPHLNKTVSQLSCGWRYKCRLAAAFTTHPDILIIDEPSFLDATSTDWLVSKISKAAKSGNAMVLIISHKEQLLDTLCDRIWYINATNLTLSSYHCGYQVFRSAHLAEVSHAERTCADYQQKVQGASKSLKNLQTQLQKREKNLTKITSEHADQRFIKGKNKEAKQKADRSAASKVKQLKSQAADMAELQRQAQRDQVKPLKITGKVADGTIAVLQDVTFAYEEGHPVFEGLDIRLEPKDRVLLRGPNGCGKSTLLKLILGELEPTGGSLKHRGKPLYFPQTSLTELTTQYGKELAVSYLGNNLTETKARLHLGHFGLKGDVALRTIMSLSAGQRVRLWLAKQLLHLPEPSLLVMDEISENLDIETRQSLSDILNGFEGAVIVVSHDADFCNSFHPTQIWNLSRDGVKVEYFDT